jgi:hypothetical protein
MPCLVAKLASLKLRVERFVTSPLPHRPVRAAFPHTVPLNRGSLINILSAICISNVYISSMSLVHLINVSKIQLPDSGMPLPYSMAFLEQISHLSIGTMSILSLPLPFSMPSVSLGYEYHYDSTLFFALYMVVVCTIYRSDAFG